MECLKLMLEKTNRSKIIGWCLLTTIEIMKIGSQITLILLGGGGGRRVIGLIAYLSVTSNIVLTFSPL